MGSWMTHLMMVWSSSEDLIVVVVKVWRCAPITIT